MTDTAPMPDVSIIIPVYNEAASLGGVLDEIAALPLEAEVIVVDDGSLDDSAAVAEARAGVRVLRQPYNIGNGAAIKAGIWAARGRVIVMMDGDGQHQPADIPRLLSHIERYDMVVGARTPASESDRHRDLANSLYNLIASYLVGRKVEDLTSGFRAIRAPIARRFVYLLPNGFSYPTTLTLSIFRAGHSVRYEPIVALARRSQSKIRLMRDGPGFLLTMARIGTLFAPLKIFLPVAITLFVIGAGYGAFFLLSRGRFSQMAGVTVLAGIMLFMLGLISEQIALLRMLQVSLSHFQDEPPE
jgi:glycosyltransferase involved in cell wall biosynthesis